MLSTSTVSTAQGSSQEKARPGRHFGWEKKKTGSQGIRGSLVCVNACACMYERARGGKGKDTQTHTCTGHEGKGGVCAEKGRRREEARLAALSLKPERSNIEAAGSQSTLEFFGKRVSCGLLFWNQQGAH